MVLEDDAEAGTGAAVLRCCGCAPTPSGITNLAETQKTAASGNGFRGQPVHALDMLATAPAHALLLHATYLGLSSVYIIIVSFGTV